MKNKGLKKVSGVMITEVYQDSAALQAGLNPGEIILSVNGHIIDSAPTLRYIIKGLPINTPLPIDILRDGKMIKVNVTLLPSTEKEELIHFTSDKTVTVPSSKAVSVGL